MGFPRSSTQKLGFMGKGAPAGVCATPSSPPGGKRRDPRLDVDGGVFVKVTGAEKESDIPETKLFHSVKNVSRGGMLLWGNKKLRVGAVLHFVVAFSDNGKSFRLTGEVRWTREPTEGFCQAGMMFLPTSQDIEAWRTHVDRRLAQSNRPAWGKM